MSRKRRNQEQREAFEELQQRKKRKLEIERKLLWLKNQIQKKN